MFLGHFAFGSADKRATPKTSTLIAAVTGLLMLATTTHAMVPVPNGNDPGPCTLTIYWDDRVSGCGEVLEGTARDSLLNAAIENARQVMRAWRRHRPDLIVPYRPGVSDSAIRAEMHRTQYVDSMAVSIDSDSIEGGVAELHTRYWLARTVRWKDGYFRRQVERVDYREAWRLTARGWRLQGFVEGESEAFAAAPPSFPVRPGVSVGPSAMVERFRTSADERMPCGPPDEAPPVTEPVPLSIVHPTYPEFARVAGIQGNVILHVCVDAQGKVVRVLVGRGVMGLNEAAMDAVRKWEFDPAVDKDDNPVSSWVDIPVDFHF